MVQPKTGFFNYYCLFVMACIHHPVRIPK